MSDIKQYLALAAQLEETTDRLQEFQRDLEDRIHGLIVDNLTWPFEEIHVSQEEYLDQYESYPEDQRNLVEGWNAMGLALDVTIYLENGDEVSAIVTIKPRALLSSMGTWSLDRDIVLDEDWTDDYVVDTKCLMEVE